MNMNMHIYTATQHMTIQRLKTRGGWDQNLLVSPQFYLFLSVSHSLWWNSLFDLS